MKQVTFTDEEFATTVQLLDVAVKAIGLQCVEGGALVLRAMNRAVTIEVAKPEESQTVSDDLT